MTDNPNQSPQHAHSIGSLSCSSELRFPPLTIGDLILLTLSVACVFGCIAPGFRDALKEPTFGLSRIASEFVQCFAIGISLFGLIMLGRERVRGRKSLSSPGHWILIAVGPYSVLLLAQTLYGPILRTWISKPETLVVVSNGIVVFVLLMSIIGSALGLRTMPVRWQLVLVSAIGWLMLSGAGLFLFIARQAGIRIGDGLIQPLVALHASAAILAAAMCCLATAVDVARRIRRDWLHYVGVVCLILTATTLSLTWGAFALKWWQKLYYYLLS